MPKPPSKTERFLFSFDILVNEMKQRCYIDTPFSKQFERNLCQKTYKRYDALGAAANPVTMTRLGVLGMATLFV